MHRQLLLLFLLFAGMESQAQLSNFRKQSFRVSNDTIQLDTQSIVNGSEIIWVNGEIVEGSDYTLDPVNARFRWLKLPTADTFVVAYRVLPWYLPEPFYILESVTVPEDYNTEVPWYIIKPSTETQLFDFGSLNYSGSFTRGITFGNNQDLVVNSGFNLQLAGELPDGVEVLASITDNNIPIQPDGNTQQLQEFDKIYIQLKKNRTKLLAGDFELKRPESYFLNYYKKLQGARFDHSFKTDNGISTTIDVSGAVARGKYARMTFTGEEANQGPYKLVGNNGEAFIIVLAGTERVFIDRQLMLRGANADYTIDYNTGEITFTSNRLITKDMFIVIEFEYADNNYFRSLGAANVKWEGKGWTVHMHGYSEQDAKNQTIADSFSLEEIMVMQNVGDSLQNAFYTGAVLSEFDPDRIMYKKRDSLGYEVYIYSSNPDSANYIVNFSAVGANGGDYVLDRSLVNGRVYRWVAPVAGVSQGNYAPVRPLITPKRTQMVSIGGDKLIGKKGKLSAEFALSNNDLNTYSTVNDYDDIGLAGKIIWKGSSMIGKDSSLRFDQAVDYEFRMNRFDHIERYRAVEFEDDWNVGSENNEVNEHTAKMRLGLGKKTYRLEYLLSALIREGVYTGITNGWNARYAGEEGFKVSTSGSVLTTEGYQRTSTYLRPKAEMSKNIGSLRTGLKFAMEDNRIMSMGSDSLVTGAFSWNDIRIFLAAEDSTNKSFQLDVARRLDQTVLAGSLGDATEAYTGTLRGLWTISKQQKVDYSIAYRDLKILDTLRSSLVPKSTILSKLDYNSVWSKGAIRAGWLYEAGAGQEAAREFSYQEVPAGQGLYTWVDYNNNGLKELNEFEIAQFSDQAKYIRVFLPTNELVRTNFTTFNYNLNLNPKVLWKNAEGLRKTLSYLSLSSSIQLKKKILNADLGPALNPFDLDVVDTNLVSLSNSWRNILYINRGGSELSGNLTYRTNRSKSLLVNGLDTRTDEYYEGNGIWNINSSLSLEIDASTGKRTYTSEAFSGKDYEIEVLKINPSFSYLKFSSFKLQLGYIYGESSNIIEGMEQAYRNEVKLEFRSTAAGKSIFNAQVSYVDIAYDGSTSNSISYIMLDGLQPGTNYLWLAGFERSLANNLQLSLNYNGRKTGTDEAVHLGSVNLRAIF